MKIIAMKTCLAALILGILPIIIYTVDGNPVSFEPYLGIYKSGADDFISIANFDFGDGQNHLLFTDFKSGQIRILSPTSEDNFTAGSGLLINPPVEMQLSFAKPKENNSASFTWEQNGARYEASKIKLRRAPISFRNGEVTLSGTLIIPEGKSPHPAVVLLHGSGKSTRYVFGPFPDFFLTQGYAVLIYDKRGSGESNGSLEKSTFDDLAADGRAAVQFLKRSADINPHQIGFCGASQGGFLAALASAGNPDIAFIINLYGMYVPAWQQELYRAEAEMRGEGVPENEIAEGIQFTKFEFEVAQTEKGWEQIATMMQEGKNKKWWDYVPKADSLDELLSYWKKDYSYDPSLALERVSCPILALFGKLDRSTPVDQSIANMQHALKIAGNNHFTFKIFPKGNHGLLESETGANTEIPKLRRLVPGVFETMSDWLRNNVAQRPK